MIGFCARHESSSAFDLSDRAHGLAGALRRFRPKAVAALLVAAVLTTGGCPTAAPGPGDGTGDDPAQGAVGAAGPRGPAGPAGADGADGADGKPGATGPRGLTGPAGADGRDGKNGAPGAPGAPGVDGSDGADGQACWDINGNGVADLASEDANADGVVDVLDCHGDDPPGTPQIESIVDTTGRPLVIGDIIQINGRNLAEVDAAFVGGLAARIVSRAATNMRIQIPAGVRTAPVEALPATSQVAGLNFLHLINFDGDTGLVEAVAALRVHRLGIILGGGRDVITVFDTLDDSILSRIPRDIGDLDPPFQPDFVNNGSLVIVPTGLDRITFIDLTANPPAATDVVLGGQQVTEVSIRPDGRAAVATDPGRNGLFNLRINEILPPYEVTAVEQVGDLMALVDQPRGVAFINADTLMVTQRGADQLAVLTSIGEVLGDTGARFGTAMADPVQIRRGPGGASFLVNGAAGRGLELALAGGGGGGNMSWNSMQSVGLPFAGNSVAFDLSSDGQFAYVAGAGNADRIQAVRIGDDSMSMVASAAATSGQSVNVVASGAGPLVGQAPGDVCCRGKLYVGLADGDFVDIFDVVNGGTLTRRDSADNPLAGDADLENVVGIAIQP